jgi:DnaJ-class molecular chaperone
MLARQIRYFRSSHILLRNFYNELGIQPSASDQEIKKAYFALAKKYHPDVNPDADARPKFEKIAQAYETLSDQQKRDAYDRQ